MGDVLRYKKTDRTFTNLAIHILRAPRYITCHTDLSHECRLAIDGADEVWPSAKATLRQSGVNKNGHSTSTIMFVSASISLVSV